MKGKRIFFFFLCPELLGTRNNNSNSVRKQQVSYIINYRTSCSSSSSWYDDVPTCIYTHVRTRIRRYLGTCKYDSVSLLGRVMDGSCVRAREYYRWIIIRARAVSFVPPLNSNTTISLSLTLSVRTLALFRYLRVRVRAHASVRFQEIRRLNQGRLLRKLGLGDRGAKW